MDKYNDNELLYLLSENDENAFDMLMEKYEPMIINRLTRYHVKSEYWDDYYQECIILLYKCAISYREDITKTFNRYYDRMLQFQIRNLLRRDKPSFYRVILMSSEDIDSLGYSRVEEKRWLKPMSLKSLGLDDSFLKMLYNGSTIKEIAKQNNLNYYQAYNLVKKLRGKMFRDDISNPLSSFENSVYELYKEGYKSSEIANILSVEPNKVYNAMKRIRNKEKSKTRYHEI